MSRRTSSWSSTTGRPTTKRPAKTLSGGETFVASLALALALSQSVPELRSVASASLDSLFLDEGFGTLDQESLNQAIDALEGLRSEERLVGIITHVPELASRIECRIEVSKAREGSTLRIVGMSPRSGRAGVESEASAAGGRP